MDAFLQPCVKGMKTAPVKSLTTMPASVKEVFDLPELREMIITRAIFSPQNNSYVVCRKTIKSLRQVSKDWLTSVSKVMRKEKKAVFNLVLDKSNSLEESASVAQGNGKLLDNFVSKTYTAAWNIECPPTFSLKIMEEFFCEENYDNFTSCLTRCGKSIVNLEMSLPVNCGFPICIFPHFGLPLCQKMTFKYLGVNPLELQAGSTHNLINMISSFLNAAQNLKEFSMPNFKGVPNGFQYISMPSTITALELLVYLSSDQLGILIRNRFSSLTTLTLQVPAAVPFTDGLVFRVLENSKKSLRVLKIYGVRYLSENTPPTLVAFPKLEKLETLFFCGSNCELEENAVSLESIFPKLKFLSLRQTETGFRKWTESATHPGISSLEFRKYIARSPRNLDPTLPLNLETMQQVHKAFPNVKSLELTFAHGLTCGLKYVFMEMKQLTYLRLIQVENEALINSDVWDALLIGMSLDLVAGMRTSPEFWQFISFANEALPSIRMLTELQTLSLEVSPYKPGNSEIPQLTQPLISDLSFIHGLLKMPKLRSLYLQGRFKASDNMSSVWKNEKRFLSYRSQ